MAKFLFYALRWTLFGIFKPLTSGCKKASSLSHPNTPENFAPVISIIDTLFTLILLTKSQTSKKIRLEVIEILDMDDKNLINSLIMIFFCLNRNLKDLYSDTQPL